LLSLKRFVAIFLACLMTALPGLSEPQSGGQHAGQITALIPAATRNTQPAKTNDDVQWSDLLKTAHSGRLRVGLTDGSILSLGSDSELRVVQHDAATQQSSLELNYGKVRSQVQKITQPGGKFEIKTPNAVIGVIGTKLYVAYEAGKTTVICYEGQISVSALGNARMGNNTGQTGSSGNSVTLNPGQMVEITDAVPPGGFQSSQVPPSVAQNGILSTEISEKEPPVYHASHVPVWVAVGYGVAVGLALGITMGTGNGKHKTPQPPTCPPESPACG
jgi:archaellum component FlaG (FlaF/FlaG flagellin family)